MTVHTKPQSLENLLTDTLTPVSVAFGDGIGPEIMSAALKVMLAAGARIAVEPVEMGEACYLAGCTSGIPDDTWESLRRTKVLFKAPITTPQGGGYKSLNVTIRKSLGLYANVRPCVSYAPFVATRHPEMDVVIVRENEEDLYAGIEHRQTDEVYQCLKLVSRPGCERIVRYAFEYARKNGRKKVTCFSKDNIMKLTDGLFHKVFDEIGAEYPEIEKDHMIIDIGAAKLAAAPGMFDVIVTLNLYGDIISDIAAEVSGSVGLAGSANIGGECAMFEAIHGSAPTIAGQDVANPSGLLLSGVMMLVHIGQPEIATRIHNAWLKTIEDGIHTPDVFSEGKSRDMVGTQAFAEAVVARLGQKPSTFAPVHYEAAAAAKANEPTPKTEPRKASAVKEIAGIDVFVHAAGAIPDELAKELKACADSSLTLSMISNRGIKVWPDGLPETLATDHWRCRFLATGGKALSHSNIVSLLDRLSKANVDFIKTEHLCRFDGVAAYSLGQGE